VIAKSPHNARAFNNLGIALAESCDGERPGWRRHWLSIGIRAGGGQCGWRSGIPCV
jgi:hypothetical protein